MAVSHFMERVQMADKDGDPEDDLELDPPINDDENQDEQDNPDDAEQESDEPQEPDQIDAQSQGNDRQDGEQRQQPSRGERRHQALANEVRERDRQITDLNRRLDALIAGQARPQQQGESPDARAARQALLTPEERIREDLQVAQQGHAREMHSLRLTIQDSSDRAAFEAKATVDPLYDKWKPKVEAELADLRAKGQNVDREKLMYYLIGQNAVSARKQSSGRQRTEARGRVTRQQTRPSNSGSDTSANRRDRNTSLERRLEDQSI